MKHGELRQDAVNYLEIDGERISLDEYPLDERSYHIDWVNFSETIHIEDECVLRGDSIGYNGSKKFTCFWTKSAVDEGVDENGEFDCFVNRSLLDQITGYIKRKGYGIKDIVQEGQWFRIDFKKSFEKEDLGQLRKTLREFRFGENTSSEIQPLTEGFLQELGVREGLEDHVQKLLENARKLWDLNGGYGSLGVKGIEYEIGSIDGVVKAGTKKQIEREAEVYELLKGTKTSLSIPEYKSHALNCEVGFIALGKYRRRPISLERMLKNPSTKNKWNYIHENLIMMAQFHTDLTRRAKEEGKEFTTEQGYNTNSNPHIELISDPLQNNSFNYFKSTRPSLNAIADAVKLSNEVTRIIAEESDCIIHGDWKPENGLIYDFSDVRKGNELEDIMRFMTNYIVNGTRKEARDAVNLYINYRSEVDVEFRDNHDKQNRLRRYADMFYKFETSLYALRANKRDLRIPEKRNEREAYILGLVV